MIDNRVKSSGTVGNKEEVMRGNDRAYRVLSEAVNLLDDMQRAESLKARSTHLEEVSKLTGISPAILLFAMNHGTHAAHVMFLKDEFAEGDDGEEEEASACSDCGIGAVASTE